jgi:hypothetical protein
MDARTNRRTAGGRACDHPVVRIVASDSARELVEERGGRLYVWLKKDRCCGGSIRLLTASSPPPGKDFCRFEGCERFELYLPAQLGRLPDELHVEARRFPRRLEAYWNGCAWAT